MHVFTYGTLMYPEVWRAVVGREFATVGGRAAGFAIYRVQDAVFPGIIAATPQEAAPGVVYLDVDQASVDRLDRFDELEKGANKGLLLLVHDPFEIPGYSGGIEVTAVMEFHALP